MPRGFFDGIFSQLSTCLKVHESTPMCTDADAWSIEVKVKNELPPSPNVEPLMPEEPIFRKL